MKNIFAFGPRLVAQWLVTGGEQLHAGGHCHWSLAAAA